MTYCGIQPFFFHRRLRHIISDLSWGNLISQSLGNDGGDGGWRSRGEPCSMIGRRGLSVHHEYRDPGESALHISAPRRDPKST